MPRGAKWKRYFAGLNPNTSARLIQTLLVIAPADGQSRSCAYIYLFDKLDFGPQTNKSLSGIVIVHEPNQNNLLMLKNYLVTAMRSLLRNKGFAITNILGLVVGISFSTMLYIYISHELSYDSFHSRSSRTYRVLTSDLRNPSDVRTYAMTVPALGPELVNTFPEVEEMVRLYRPSGQVVVTVGKENYNERNWFTTSDANFFNIFDFEFINGDPATALTHPLSVVLSESTARRFFGNADVLGTSIEVGGAESVKVTGVLKDLPQNSHLQFDLLFSALQPGPGWEQYLNSWDRFGAATYVVLKDGDDIGSVSKRIPALMEKHMGDNAQIQSTSFQSIEDIYLYSEGIESGVEGTRGELTYIYIFSSMAIFLLVLAAINYINLTTSNAVTRAKEIGVRKVAGAFRKQLVFQFMTETLAITTIATMLALVMIDLSLPFFNRITGKDFDLNLTNLATYVPPLLSIAIVIALLAGTYPAFYLARLKPVTSLRIQSLISRHRIDLRSVLVVFQFTVSITLIVSTLIIGKQLEFIEHKDLGFVRSGLMVIDINSGDVRREFQTMKTEFLKVPGVEHVAVSTRVPGEWKNIPEVYARTSSGDSIQSYFMGFDEDILQTYQLELTEGRFFTVENPADSSGVLINASAVKAMGLNEPIGSTLRIGTRDGTWEVNVIGVLDDFNFQSLHNKVAPMIIGHRNNPIQYIDYFTLRVSGDLNQIIAGATSVHSKFDTRTPIEYHFLTDQLNTFYVAEQKAGLIFKLAGVLSTFIACLGLLGLLTHYLQRKTKELAIRKVVGAGSASLFFMVYKAFLKQVLIAFAIASPLAWYTMRTWLNAFEYRISIGVDTFALAAVAVLFVLTITVFYHAAKAARFNPVKLLRSE